MKIKGNATSSINYKPPIFLTRYSPGCTQSESPEHQSSSRATQPDEVANGNEFTNHRNIQQERDGYVWQGMQGERERDGDGRFILYTADDCKGAVARAIKTATKCVGSPVDFFVVPHNTQASKKKERRREEKSGNEKMARTNDFKMISCFVIY